jgi:hypothetical protein
LGTGIVDDSHTWILSVDGVGYRQNGILSGTFELCPLVPAPGALMLASAGVGLVGWFRRNQSL